MTFSIRRGTLALTSPNAIVATSTSFWLRVVDSLRVRGAGVRESGCFLLGEIYAGVRFVNDVVYYDDLDPTCLLTGAIDLQSSAFVRVWDICKAKGLSVVADVHTHPGLAFQSGIDERNPAISTPGHVAMILPDLAMTTRRHEGLGIFVYRGAYQWENISLERVSRTFALRSWL